MILDHSGIFWGVALITVVGFSAEVNRLCGECSCARLPYELAYTLMASFRMFSMPSTFSIHSMGIPSTPSRAPRQEPMSSALALQSPPARIFFRTAVTKLSHSSRVASEPWKLPGRPHALPNLATASVAEAVAKFGKACGLPGSFQGSLATLLECDNFVTAVRKNILAGGDCNARALLIGSCLGARLGVEGIPMEWIEKVNGMEDILKDAIKVYASS